MTLSRRRRWRVAVASATALACAGGAALLACSDMDAAATGTAIGPDGGTTGPTRDAGGPAVPELVSDGVLLVHAAALPPLRLCFERRGDDLPVPLDVLMPESNVVGLDVGSVVRLPNLEGPFGQVYAFPEESLRGSTKKCKELVTDSQLGTVSHRLGALDADLSKGLHLVAVTGCAPLTDDPEASKARCGASWDAAAGNLALVVAELEPQRRTSPSSIAVQVVQLSGALDEALGDTGYLGLGVQSGDATPSIVLAARMPFGEPHPSAPTDVQLPLSSAQGDGGAAAFASTSLVLQIGRGDAGGPPSLPFDGGSIGETVLTQSLAETQRLTLPSALPPDFFATVSSFVLLSVGELPPKGELPDAGRDPRTLLHLLAVPLAVPEAPRDAGPRDGGGPR